MASEEGGQPNTAPFSLTTQVCLMTPDDRDCTWVLCAISAIRAQSEGVNESGQSIASLQDQDQQLTRLAATMSGVKKVEVNHSALLFAGGPTQASQIQNGWLHGCVHP